MDPFENQLRDVLREAGNQPTVADKVMARIASEPSAPSRRRNRFLILAAAALSAAALLLFALRTNDSLKAVIRSADGLVRQEGTAVAAGGSVEGRKSVHSEGRSMLVLSDGSEMEVRPNSEFSLEPAEDGIRVHLQSGSVIVKAAKQAKGRHLYVQTRDVAVSVIGTVFFVDVEEEGSHVAVLEGQVQIRHGANEKTLISGDQVSTARSATFLSLKEEISWSREVEKLVSLLPSSVIPDLPPSISQASPEFPHGLSASSREGSILIDAAQEGHLEVVRQLLDRGIDPNASSPGDGSPLIAAAKAGRLPVVRLLLDRGANPNMAVTGDGNPLIAAAGEGRLDVVSLLLDRGARIDEVVPYDENALITASREGRLNVVQLLVSRGANVNAKVWSDSPSDNTRGEWRTPLGMARAEGHDDIAQFLISSGAKE